MIESVTLTCFRKHLDATFNFTAGLNCLRGNSEAGKSTVLEAISYALWGTKALRTSLEDAVTYGQPQTTLRVVLVMVLDGVSYRISRGKSGAEIIYGDHSVTGQTETRTFVERLFRCSADVAKNLMFADQNAVRGILSEGPTATSGLVESLSGLGLIESLIDKVQAQLPSGNTGAIESQIVMLTEDQLVTPEKPSDLKVLAAEEEFSQFSAKIDLSEQAVPGDQEVARAMVAVDAFNAAQARISKIMPLLGASVAHPGYTEEDLANLRNSQANSAEMSRRRKAYATVFPISDFSWENTGQDYSTEVQKNKALVLELETKVTAINLAINTATVLKINEKACVFCRKDLTDVPEVAAVNLASDQKIAKLTTELAAIKSALAEAKSAKQAYATLDALCVNITNLAGDYWDLSNAIPPVPTWKGAVPEPEVPQVNIAVMEKALRVYQAEMTKREILETELASLEDVTFNDVSEDLALLKEHKAALAALAAIKLEQAQASRAAREERIRYTAALTAYNLLLAQIGSQAAQLAALKATLSDMHKHNELVKRLRSIRPQVAAQLWTTVLGATSHYFSAIRGQSSVVTRDATGFRVDGKGVLGLSGSTLDALGLAIRMSLSKLFLPGVPFLFLDESFSACDNTRELAGVGTIASAGFSQVLLVTHSDLPEAVADNLLVL